MVDDRADFIDACNISREQAKWIAADNLKLRGDPCARMAVTKVVRLNEITYARPHAYNVPPQAWEDGWIVYMADSTFVGLCSSTVMLISRSTGHMIYFGSANDEG
jgi:hypothetical protein